MRPFQPLTIVDAGGTTICIHLHVSRLLYHCSTDADGFLYNFWLNNFLLLQRQGDLIHTNCCLNSISLYSFLTIHKHVHTLSIRYNSQYNITCKYEAPPQLCFLTGSSPSGRLIINPLNRSCYSVRTHQQILCLSSSVPNLSRHVQWQL